MESRLTAADATAAERFDRWAGIAALAAAALAILYSIAFVVLKAPLIYSLSLLVGSLLSAVALLAVYEHVRPGGLLARLGAGLALAGLVGAAVHGAYDLALVIHPEEGASGGGPFPVDPRGFLTFGLTGLGMLILSAAGLGLAVLPRPLLFLGLLFGVLLVVVYLGRLIVLDAASPLVAGPAAATGLIVGPLWYAWVGWLLLMRSR